MQNYFKKALVSSHLDYCNSLLLGAADTDLTELQNVHNRLFPVVTKSELFTLSILLLHSLPWLPVQFRDGFKMCVLTCKTLHEKQPVYLHIMLATSLPSRSLRSNKGITLSVPRVKTSAGAGHFALVPLLFARTSHCLPFQLPPFPPSVNVSICISITWPFPHRFQLARWPIDVMELLHRFCC